MCVIVCVCVGGGRCCVHCKETTINRTVCPQRARLIHRCSRQPLTALTAPNRCAQALHAPPGGAPATEQAEHRRACLGGLARVALRLGDVAAGKAAALQVRSLSLLPAGSWQQAAAALRFGLRWQMSALWH